MIASLYTQSDLPARTYFTRFFAVFISCIGIAVLINPFWNTALLHALLEFVSVFLGFNASFIIFLIHHRIPRVSIVIGFGLLAVSIFDLFHSVFSFDFPLYPQVDPDVSMYYWFFGRFILVLLLFYLIRKKKRPFPTPSGLLLLGFLLTLTLSLAAVLLLLNQPDLLPSLIGEDGLPTPIKTGFHYLLSLLFFFGLLGLIRQSRLLPIYPVHRYKIVVVLFTILAELLISSQIGTYEYRTVLSHLFKVCSFFYIHKAVFDYSVIYPHEQLSQAHQTVHGIMNYFPQAILTLDDQGTIRFANQKAFDLLTCHEDDLKGLRLNLFFNKFGFTAWKGPQQGDMELQAIKSRFLQRSDDLGKLQIYKLNQFRLSSGSVLLLDETKKDQTLDQLQLQSKTLLDAIHSMVLITDPEWNILAVNQIFLDMQGYEEDEIKGVNIRELMLRFDARSLEAPDVPPSLDQISQLFVTGKVYEFFCVNKSGSKGLLTVESSPIRNVNQELIGLIWLLDDITEQSQMRKMMVHQEKLAVLGQMAAGIVHEIKNPLTSIKGFSQMILQKSQETSILRFARIIEEETEQVNRVVSDFLLFAKPRKPFFEQHLLSRVLRSVEPMIDTQLFVSGIKFEQSLPLAEESVLVDDDQIKQVLLNLIKNATEALEGIPKPSIYLILDYLMSSRQMRISIKDNGVGIPPEQQAQIGTPFHTTKEKGTGLGLSICYQMVKENGGSLSFESILGQGTTFHLDLPCIEENPPGGGVYGVATASNTQSTRFEGFRGAEIVAPPRTTSS